MKKIYLKLTKDQKARGVIFSSTLMTNRKGSSMPIVTHEVLATDDNRQIKIDLLLNDKFFSNSPYKYNAIRK